MWHISLLWQADLFLLLFLRDEALRNASEHQSLVEFGLARHVFSLLAHFELFGLGLLLDACRYVDIDHCVSNGFLLFLLRFALLGLDQQLLELLLLHILALIHQQLLHDLHLRLLFVFITRLTGVLFEVKNFLLPISS